MNRFSIVFLTLIVIFTGFLFLNKKEADARHLADNNCLGIYGKFTAKNWPGGTVDVACGGNTRISGKCTGNIKTVKPGQTFDFHKCNCPPYSSGCLKVAKKLRLQAEPAKVAGHTKYRVVEVEKLSSKCRIAKPLACGVNGQSIEGSFKIICDEENPTPTPTPTPSPTVTPTPTPTICPVPGQVTNIQVICPDCEVEENNE